MSASGSDVTPTGAAKHVSARPTVRELVSLAEGAALDDAALSALETRAGGHDAFIALALDAALGELDRASTIARSGLGDAENAHGLFQAQMAKLQASQRETKTLIEDLVNG